VRFVVLRGFVVSLLIQRLRLGCRSGEFVVHERESLAVPQSLDVGEGFIGDVKSDLVLDPDQSFGHKAVHFATKVVLLAVRILVAELLVEETEELLEGLRSLLQSKKNEIGAGQHVGLLAFGSEDLAGVTHDVNL